MDLDRGDIVVALIPGDYGKARPALVVQSDAYNATHSSIVVCPVTSHVIETPLFRILLNLSPATGLETASQVMVDKITAIKRERIAKIIGRVEPSVVHAVDQALRSWLDLLA